MDSIIFFFILSIHLVHKFFNDNSYWIKSSFIWVLKCNNIITERSNKMTRTEIILTIQCTWKTKFLRTSSVGLFRTPSERISHRIHIVRISCSQTWDFLLSCWGCFLTLWLEIDLANDKFDFSGDNYYAKLPAKLC